MLGAAYSSNIYSIPPTATVTPPVKEEPVHAPDETLPQDKRERLLAAYYKEQQIIQEAGTITQSSRSSNPRSGLNASKMPTASPYATFSQKQPKSQTRTLQTNRTRGDSPVKSNNPSETSGGATVVLVDSRPDTPTTKANEKLQQLVEVDIQPLYSLVDTQNNPVEVGLLNKVKQLEEIVTVQHEQIELQRQMVKEIRERMKLFVQRTQTNARPSVYATSRVGQTRRGMPVERGYTGYKPRGTTTTTTTRSAAATTSRSGYNMYNTRTRSKETPHQVEKREAKLTSMIDRLYKRNQQVSPADREKERLEKQKADEQRMQKMKEDQERRHRELLRRRRKEELERQQRKEAAEKQKQQKTTQSSGTTSGGATNSTSSPRKGPPRVVLEYEKQKRKREEAKELERTRKEAEMKKEMAKIRENNIKRAEREQERKKKAAEEAAAKQDSEAEKKKKEEEEQAKKKKQAEETERLAKKKRKEEEEAKKKKQEEEAAKKKKEAEEAEAAKKKKKAEEDAAAAKKKKEAEEAEAAAAKKKMEAEEEAAKKKKAEQEAAEAEAAKKKKQEEEAAAAAAAEKKETKTDETSQSAPTPAPPAKDDDILSDYDNDFDFGDDFEDTEPNAPATAATSNPASSTIDATPKDTTVTTTTTTTDSPVEMEDVPSAAPDTARSLPEVQVLTCALSIKNLPTRPTTTEDTIIDPYPDTLIVITCVSSDSDKNAYTADATSVLYITDIVKGTTSPRYPGLFAVSAGKDEITVLPNTKLDVDTVILQKSDYLRFEVHNALAYKQSSATTSPGTTLSKDSVIAVGLMRVEQYLQKCSSNISIILTPAFDIGVKPLLLIHPPTERPKTQRLPVPINPPPTEPLFVKEQEPSRDNDRNTNTTTNTQDVSKDAATTTSSLTSTTSSTVVMDPPQVKEQDATKQDNNNTTAALDKSSAKDDSVYDDIYDDFEDDLDEDISYTANPNTIEATKKETKVVELQSTPEPSKQKSLASTPANHSTILTPVKSQPVTPMQVHANTNTATPKPADPLPPVPVTTTTNTNATPTTPAKNDAPKSSFDLDDSFSWGLDESIDKVPTSPPKPVEQPAPVPAQTPAPAPTPAPVAAPLQPTVTTPAPAPTPAPVPIAAPPAPAKDDDVDDLFDSFAYDLDDDFE